MSVLGTRSNDPGARVLCAALVQSKERLGLLCMALALLVGAPGHPLDPEHINAH